MLNNGIDRNAVKPISNYYENPETIPSGIFSRIVAITENLSKHKKRQWTVNRQALAVKLLTAMFYRPFEQIKFTSTKLRRWKNTTDKDITAVLNYFVDKGYIKLETPYCRVLERAGAYSINPDIIRQIAVDTKFNYIATSPSRNGYRNAVLNCLHDKKPINKNIRFENFESMENSENIKKRISESVVIFCLDQAFMKLIRDKQKTIKKKKELWGKVRKNYPCGILKSCYSYSDKTHRIYTKEPAIESLNKYFRDDPSILRKYGYSVDINGSHPSIIQAIHNRKPSQNLTTEISRKTETSKTIVKGITLPAMNGQGLHGYIATRLKLSGYRSKNKIMKFKASNEAKKILNNPAHPKHKKAMKLKKTRAKVIKEYKIVEALPANEAERKQMNFIEAEIIQKVAERFKGNFIMVHDCIMVQTLKEAKKIRKMIAIESQKILSYYLSSKIVYLCG